MLAKSFDTVKKCTQSFFRGNQYESKEILFSLHVGFPASGQNYIKPCFFLVFSEFPLTDQKKTSWMIKTARGKQDKISSQFEEFNQTSDILPSIEP